MICTKYNALSFRDVQDQFITGHPFQTDCNSLLRVSVTSLAVVADVYMVDYQHTWKQMLCLMPVAGHW
jgi:hypothetical protein